MLTAEDRVRARALLAATVKLPTFDHRVEHTQKVDVDGVAARRRAGLGMDDMPQCS